MATTNLISQAENILFHQTDLSIFKLQNMVDDAASNGVNFADIYLQLIQSEAWSLEEGIIKNCSFNVDRGFGCRVVCGEKTGFAYGNNLTLTNINEALGIAGTIVKHGASQRVATTVLPPHKQLYLAADPLSVLTEDQKIQLLRELEAAAFSIDQRVKKVFVSLAGSYEVVLVVASDTGIAADIRPLIRVNVTVLAEQGGRLERGTAGGGGRYGYDQLLEGDQALAYAKEATRQALVNLSAKDAPAGTMPVVLGAGWPGVLLHEAVGHGLEGDFNRKQTSVFAGKLGEQVASSHCTIVDEGSLAGARRGSLHIDDEGTPTQRTVLIKDGVLAGYMFDKLNAHLMQTHSTGNGRRESYAALPIPRMTNTYMLAGASEPQEIIASVERGIYAVNFSGGQVDITSGKFVFSTSEAYLLEKGRVSTPLKGVTLIGDGYSVLNKVSMVGNDLELDTGVGVCGKDGQGVPVGVGQPTLRVDAMTVGGTAL